MIKLRANMGSLDRFLRVIAGIILLGLGPFTDILSLPTIFEVVLTVIGIFAILSALFSYCLLYELTGSNTRKE